jgi:hypothetical protein
MKSNSRDDAEFHNLVMFPSSKNFKVDLKSIQIETDPLRDLLNEYAHVSDGDIPIQFDERFESETDFILEDVLEGDSYHSLEAFMTRNHRGENQSPDDKLVAIINERINGIKEAKERIKFYLDEIEMFLPSRKK